MPVPHPLLGSSFATAAAALLIGCTNCGQVPVLKLQEHAPAPAIKTSHDQGDLWLDHPLFAIAVGACVGNPAASYGPAPPLCAKLFVHQGATLRFERAEFRLLDLSSGDTWDVPMKGQGFRPLEPIVGSDYQRGSGYSRHARERGTPEYFRLLEFRPPHAVALAMPRVEVNGEWVALPALRADPAMEMRFAQGV